MATPIYLPPLIQKIILDPSGVKGGAGAYAQSMSKVGKQTGQVANELTAAGGSMNTLAFRAQTAGRTLLKGFALPLLGIGALAVKSFASFENSMVRIESLVGVSTGGVNQFTEAVKKSARETGRGPQELAEAMFFVASAGLRGATAMEVLAASAKGAALGLGQTKVVADAATSAVNAYGAESLSGGAAVDVLTAAVREGKIEANRLAPAIGKAIPVASAMGIQFHEVAAAIASMTRTGTDARTSAIQLRQIMQSILDPSRQATTAMKEMGIAEGELRRQAEEEGLLSVLKRLRDLADENSEAFADVFPNIRALAGALDITGANLQENEQIFASLANSVGDTDVAFRKYQETIQFKVTKATADFKVAVIDMGEAFSPMVDALIVGINLVTRFAKLLDNNIFGAVAVSVGLLATALAVATIALSKFVVMTQASAAALAVQATTAGIASRALIGLSAAMKFTPWLLAISFAGMLAGALMGVGKDSKSTEKEVRELGETIKDIKTIGELSVKPVLDFADAIRDVGAASEALKLTEGFDQAFGEDILKAGDIGIDAGAIQAGEALLTMFGGQGDTPAIREAIEILQTTLGDQFGDEFFTRLFPSGDEYEAAFTDFLTDSGGGDNAIRVIKLQAERVATEVNKALDLAMKQGTNVRKTERAAGRDTFGIDPDALRRSDIGAMGDVMANALEAQGEQITDLLRNGKLAEAGFLYNTLITNFADSMSDSLDDDDFAQALTIFSQGLQDAIAGSDLLEGDFSDFGAFDHATAGTLPEMLLAVAAAANEVRGEESKLGKGLYGPDRISGAQNYIDWAELFVKNLEIIMDDEEKLNGLQTWEIHAMALEKASAEAHELNLEERKAKDAGMSLGRVGGVLDQMATAFASASAEAKKLDDRFDDLIGRQISMAGAQMDFNDGLRDMAGAIIDSGGSLDMNSVTGRDALRAIHDQIMMIGSVGSALIEGGVDTDVANAAMQEYLASLTATALAAGVTESALEGVFADTNVNLDVLALTTANENDEATEGLIKAGEDMVLKAGPFLFKNGVGLGIELNAGIVEGLHISNKALQDDTTDVMSKLVDAIKIELGISSPSIVFRDEVGKAMAQGLINGFTNTLVKDTALARNAIRQFVDDAIGVTSTQINSASSAIAAVMDLEDAQHALLKAMRDTTNLETGGSRSRLEDLTGRQLAERVNEAKRALRLGQGNQTDLLISLAQAENALADFEAQVDSGSPVAKAQLGVMAAAEGAAIAEAELRMEGEAAIAAFKNMAEAVGLADSALGLLTKVDEEDMNVFEKIFSQEVIDAIDLVGQGIGLINEELDEAAQRDAAIDAAIIPPGQQALRPDFERSDGTWPSHFDDPSATSSRFGAKNRMFNGGSWQQMSSLGMGGPTSGLGSDGSAYAGMAAPDWTGTIDHLGGGGAAPFGGGYGNIGSVSVNAINVTVSSVSDIGSGAMTGVMDSVMDAEVSGSKLAPRPN